MQFFRSALRNIIDVVYCMLFILGVSIILIYVWRMYLCTAARLLELWGRRITHASHIPMALPERHKMAQGTAWSQSKSHVSIMGMHPIPPTWLFSSSSSSRLPLFSPPLDLYFISQHLWLSYTLKWEYPILEREKMLWYSVYHIW